MSGVSDWAAEVLFRASSCARLMGGRSGPTAKQIEQRDYYVRRAYLAELEDLVRSGAIDPTDEQAAELASVGKPSDKAPLTANMRDHIAKVAELEDAPFAFTAGGTSYLQEVYLAHHGHEEVVVNDEMLKGQLCEQDGLALVSEALAAEGFRSKNRERFANDYLTGEPDCLLGPVVEDIKTSFTRKSFMRASVSRTYYGQLQAYMDLTGRDRARLIYCLVDTPESIVLDLLKRVYWKYGEDYENPHYREAEAKLERQHRVSDLPPAERVKVFEFGRDQDYIDELHRRCERGREVLAGLSLVAPENRVGSIQTLTRQDVVKGRGEE